MAKATSAMLGVTAAMPAQHLLHNNAVVALVVWQLFQQDSGNYDRQLLK